METNISKFIFSDIEKIFNAFNKKASIALFGSSCVKGFENAKDIDIAIFIKGISFEEARSVLSEMNLNFSMRIGSANGSYASPPKDWSTGKDYHIIILDSENPNQKFMLLNKGKLQFIHNTIEQWHYPDCNYAALHCNRLCLGSVPKILIKSNDIAI